jgi:2-amino-4-hydroxy-6-hydroxymethyldihydropteridine diphosphokinase
MRAYIGLGSNLGDRETAIRRAVGYLDEVDGIVVTAMSALRETDPWGPVEQPPFLNGAVAIDTGLDPRVLLDVLLEVERRLGRDRGEASMRWGPRTIDLDLLLYGVRVVEEPGLVVPHPHLHERRFALEPLAELAPDALVPGKGTVTALLDELLADQAG